MEVRGDEASEILFCSRWNKKKGHSRLKEHRWRKKKESRLLVM